MTMNIRVADYTDEPAVLAFMESIDGYFNPPLSTRADLGQWLKKVLSLGIILVSGVRQNLNGVVAFYCNDKKSRQAFITFLGVEKSAWRQGIGRSLLHEALHICRRENMQSALVTTEAGNAAAIALYKTAGFNIDDGESERSGKVALRLTL